MQTRRGHEGNGRQMLSGSQSGYSGRNRGQLSMVCRQLVIAHPRQTFNYTGIQSVTQAADTFIPVSVSAPERSITTLLWSHSSLKRRRAGWTAITTQHKAVCAASVWDSEADLYGNCLPIICNGSEHAVNIRHWIVCVKEQASCERWLALRAEQKVKVVHCFHIFSSTKRVLVFFRGGELECWLRVAVQIKIQQF